MQLTQAAHTAETQLRSLDLQVLVTSPFKRCLQTANTVVQSVPTCCRRIHINCKLSEVCMFASWQYLQSQSRVVILLWLEVQMLTARNLNAQDRPLPNGHIQDWMWNGSSIDAALKLAPLSGTARISVVTWCKHTHKLLPSTQRFCRQLHH